MAVRTPEPAANLANAWELWGGVTPWSRALHEFGKLGGQCIDWGGRPRGHSAVCLTFELFDVHGVKLPCENRLKDIKSAICLLQHRTTETA